MSSSRLGFAKSTVLLVIIGRLRLPLQPKSANACHRRSLLLMLAAGLACLSRQICYYIINEILRLAVLPKARLLVFYFK